jgi:hypothetical protein
MRGRDAGLHGPRRWHDYRRGMQAFLHPCVFHSFRLQLQLGITHQGSESAPSFRTTRSQLPAPSVPRWRQHQKMLRPAAAMRS